MVTSVSCALYVSHRKKNLLTHTISTESNKNIYFARSINRHLTHEATEALGGEWLRQGDIASVRSQTVQMFLTDMGGSLIWDPEITGQKQTPQLIHTIGAPCMLTARDREIVLKWPLTPPPPTHNPLLPSPSNPLLPPPLSSQPRDPFRGLCIRHLMMFPQIARTCVPLSPGNVALD